MGMLASLLRELSVVCSGDGIARDCRRFPDVFVMEIGWRQGHHQPKKKKSQQSSFESERVRRTAVASIKVIHECLYSPVSLIYMSSESHVVLTPRRLNCASTGSRESATSVRPTATNAHPSFKPPNNSFLGPFYPFGSYDT